MLRRIRLLAVILSLLAGLVATSSATAFDNPFDGGYSQQYQSAPRKRRNDPARQQYDGFGSQQSDSYGSQSSGGYGYSQQQYSYAAPQLGYPQPAAPQPGYPQQSYGAPAGYPNTNGVPRRRRRARAQAADQNETDEKPKFRQRHRRSAAVREDDEDATDKRRGRVRTTFDSDRRPSPAAAPGAPTSVAPAGQVVACVRTCDGYFFPMGQASDMGSLNAQAALCSGLCPAAKAELYLIPWGADGIDGAYGLDGKPYSKMPNAKHYTKKFDAACTCHQPNQQQVRLVSLKKDFTLRRGDAVMTTSGVFIFKGSWRWPYNVADFQLLDKAKAYLTNAVALAALEKATKWLQERATGAKKHDDQAVEASVAYVTDAGGKKVRLVGDNNSYFSAEPTIDELTSALRPTGENANSSKSQSTSPPSPSPVSKASILPSLNVTGFWN